MDAKSSLAASVSVESSKVKQLVGYRVGWSGVDPALAVVPSEALVHRRQTRAQSIAALRALIPRTSLQSRQCLAQSDRVRRKSNPNLKLVPAFPITILVPSGPAARRLDQFLVSQLPDISRVRVQQLLEQKKALVNGAPAKPSLKLKGGEQISILGDPTLPSLRAMAEAIPLDVVYEDDDLAVINKPAGMVVHAGAGSTDNARNRGTLVNALLHRFGNLSGVGGELRPGIVHRLDKQTSGLIIVARNDTTHRKLAKQFSDRQVRKRYVALVHGWPKQSRGTITAPISRDPIRRTRMTTRGSGGRTAVSHYEVCERIESRFGRFALLDVRIETGRTHQIRVHLASFGHPVVGDTLYGAASTLRVGSPAICVKRAGSCPATLGLGRNFLHAASIEFNHPLSSKPLSMAAPLPEDLVRFLDQLR